jgi:hypothetical protein
MAHKYNSVISKIPDFYFSENNYACDQNLLYEYIANLKILIIIVESKETIICIQNSYLSHYLRQSKMGIEIILLKLLGLSELLISGSSNL